MMFKYTVCDSPENFEFWSGAKETVKYLTVKEIEEIWENYLSDEEFDIPSNTDINDFFWFETDEIAHFLGYEDFDELMEDRKDKLE